MVRMKARFGAGCLALLETEKTRVTSALVLAQVAVNQAKSRSKSSLLCRVALAGTSWGQAISTDLRVSLTLPFSSLSLPNICLFSLRCNLCLSCLLSDCVVGMKPLPGERIINLSSRQKETAVKIK